VSDAALDALVQRDAEALGVALDGEARARLLEFTRLLEKWNRNIRLVGPSDTATLLREQVLEALAFRDFAARAEAWWDVGSGGGLPALVLALLDPARRFVCIEPIGKKVAFMKHAATHFGLANVHVVQGRLEDDGSPPALGPAASALPRPQAAMSRATFPPDRWVPLASRLVGPGGHVLVASADRPDDAIAACIAAGGELVAEKAYALPATQAPRHLTLLAVG
jgi:16S rRNA (guanine527-N7)-methyltransferase